MGNTRDHVSWHQHPASQNLTVFSLVSFASGPSCLQYVPVVCLFTLNHCRGQHHKCEWSTVDCHYSLHNLVLSWSTSSMMMMLWCNWVTGETGTVGRSPVTLGKMKASTSIWFPPNSYTCYLEAYSSPWGMLKPATQFILKLLQHRW